MSRIDTKERILDAAERLFAAEGFHNTSLRGLTAAAGVNLAAVNYHFGSKEALLEAVFERRLVPLNRVRRERLEAVREAAWRDKVPPKAADVLRSFIEPTLHFCESEPGAESFLPLVGRALADPDDTIRKIFMRRMEPLFLLLYETLCEALPRLSRTLIFWRLQFTLGAMGHTMCMNGRFKILPPGVEPPSDAASLTRFLLDYISAGLEAPCA
jgi:AcrR family transcriptional regulator